MPEQQHKYEQKTYEETEKTSISANHITQNLNLIALSSAKTSNEKTLTPAQLCELKMYPPGLPLSTNPIDTSVSTKNQTDEALLLGLQYTSNRKDTPKLPNISINNWDCEGEEQLYLLLPKYLFTNCIIVLGALIATNEETRKQIINNKQLKQVLEASDKKLIETARTLEFITGTLQQIGRQIIELINKGASVKQELEQLYRTGPQSDLKRKEQELKEIHHQIQRLTGQWGNTVITGSYSYYLNLLRPILKSLSNQQQHISDKVDEYTQLLMAGQSDQTPKPPFKLSQIQRKSAAAIILILGALTGATVTTQCQTCQPESSTPAHPID